MIERNGTTLALLAGIAAVAVVLGGGLVLLGAAGEAGAPGNDGTPYAGFEFEEVSVAVPAPNGSTTERAVRVRFRSGVDLPQGEVVLTVNGERAWDVTEGENGSVRPVRPWNRSGATLADDPARVVVYGQNAGTVDLGRSDGRERVGILREGDVVEVVWTDGERSAVLQRYVVGPA